MLRTHMHNENTGFFFFVICTKKKKEKKTNKRHIIHKYQWSLFFLYSVLRLQKIIFYIRSFPIAEGGIVISYCFKDEKKIT